MANILGKKEAAAKLRISEQTLDRLRARKHDPIPWKWVGTQVRFDEDEVLAWFARQDGST